MKTILHIGIWLAILVGGFLVVGCVFQRTCQGGTGNGAGYFHYSFRGCFSPMVEGDPSVEDFELEGHAPGRFMMDGGVSPVYDEVTLKWRLFHGYEGRPDGRVILDLAGNTIHDEGRTMPLDRDHLVKVLGIPDRPANSATMGYLVNLLRDCHTGQLPRPSHFGHNLAEPMPGIMWHVAKGYRVDDERLTWIGIWILAVTAFYTVRKIQTRS